MNKLKSIMQGVIDKIGKWLKRLCCKHEFEITTTIYHKEGDTIVRREYHYKCPLCGDKFVIK